MPSAPIAADVGPTSIDLSAARAALALDDFDTALAQAHPALGSDDKTVRLEAARLCAIAACELAKWPLVYDCTQKCFEQEPTAHHALQLAIAAVMTEDAKRGAAWVGKAIEINERRKELSPMLLRVRFIDALCQQGQFSQALPHLEWMKAMYLPMHSTDDALLSLRGWPVFSAFLEQSWPVASAVLVPSQTVVWYNSMLPYLDVAGQKAVRALMVERLGLPA